MNQELIMKDKQYLKTGTTTVGIVVKEAVIFGADKRATMGNFIASKYAEKILKIDDHIAATIAGGVADAQFLMDKLKIEAYQYRLRYEKPIPVNSIAKILSGILYGAKQQGPYYVYQVHHLIGGVDYKGPRMYDVGGYGSILEEKYSSTGSGSIVAYGVLEDKYSEDLSISDGVEVVKTAVRAAISRDIGSGNGVDIVIITADNFEKKHFKPF
ncbi:MAG: proteasome subunit beta [Promethearchaeota archaeon]